MENINPNIENINIKISDIEPITESRNTEIRSREDLKGLVEGPLLSACQELYDKNIRTTATTANKNNVGNFAEINIEFDTLSDINKEIGRTLGEVHFSDNTNHLNIKIPVNVGSTFGEIRLAAEEAAHKFEKQPYVATVYTLQDLRSFCGIDPDDESFGVESFSSDYYWSPEHQLFFLSEEQFKKATEKENKGYIK